MYVALIYGICLTVLLLIGISALLDRQKSTVNQVFALFIGSIIAWMGSLFLAYQFEGYEFWTITFIRLANAIPLFTMYFLLLFFSYFPRRTSSVATPLALIFGCFTVVAFGISAFTPLVQTSVTIQGGDIVDETLGPLFFYIFLYYLGIIIVATILGLRKSFHLRGIELQKIRLSLSGFVIFIAFILTTNIVLPLFGIIVLVKESVLFSLFFTVPTFYAIQKHRFFNVSHLSLNFLRTAILVLVYLAVVGLTHGVLISANAGFNELTTLLISALVGLAILKPLENKFPRIISNEEKVFRKSINELQAKLATCETFTGLEHAVEQTFVRKLHFDRVKIFALRKASANIGIPVYQKDDFSRNLKKYKTQILVKEEIEYLSLTDHKKKNYHRVLEQEEAAACLCLYTEDKLIGLLFIGSKHDGDSFSAAEIEEILRVQKRITTCLMNSLIKQNLQEENDLLRTIINERTSLLQKQFDEIKRLLNLQSDFLAVTAHEFRTPLSIAMFQLEDTMESHQLTPEVIKEMEVLESSLLNLQGLTQSLFDVQQFDLNKVSLSVTKTNIVQFTTDVFSTFNILAKKSGFQCQLENQIKNNVEIEIDQSLIRQVLHNFLNNTKKFVPAENGQITISLEETPQEVVIKVIDNGPGVKDENKQRIFEKFQSEKAEQGMGIGLGLYLCKKIIELHNGHIGIEDTPGGGATFFIRLRK